MFKLGLLLSAALGASAALDVASDATSRAVSGLDTPSGGSLNGPNSRGQWSPGYDISNDTDNAWPVTGKVREYFFTVTNTTCNADGAGPINCMLVNGQFPGPTITADWGDTIRVHVSNQLKDNGTSMHWHGVRQYKTNLQDGTNGVTECPIAPGTNRTYEWIATQYGTTWYHSHHSSQYGAGVQGPIVINGPATANYDIDLGPLLATDYYHQPFFTAAAIEMNLALKGIEPPPTDQILFNGKNKDKNGHGSYYTVTVQPGKKHRLRLINTSAEAFMRFSIDNHTMTVVAADFVPITPYVTNSLLLSIGQRYDVVFTANQAASSYWMRAPPEFPCSVDIAHPGVGVLTYANSTVSIPPSPEPKDSPYSEYGCAALTDIKPYWKPSIPKEKFVSTYKPIGLDFNFTFANAPPGDFIQWRFNQTGIDIFWDKPVVQYVAEKNTSYPPRLAVYDLNNKPGDWVFFVIQAFTASESVFSHPIHLHGHDYYTLGQDVGTFNASTDFAKLDFNNPVRRDTNFLNGDGGFKKGNWMAIAFQTGNPGTWLLHCHIASHIAGGFGMQFLDTKDQMQAPSSDFAQQCAAWKSYQAHAYWRKGDSGL